MFSLFCAEDSVACVAETGNNVAMLIELLVESCTVNVNIGMSLLESCKSLGSCNMCFKGHATESGNQRYVTRGISMREIEIMLSSIEDVKHFVQTITMFDGEFELVSGKYIVDAKYIENLR